MIDLTLEEYEKAPKLVQWLFFMANCNYPVELEKYNEIKEKYPYYFEVRSNSKSVV